MSAWWYVVAAVVGTLCGSFYNVCICRIPRGESVVAPPSHCGACGGAVAWYDNVPVLSYIVLGGRCRACGAIFSVRYLLVELAGGVLAGAVLAKFGFSWQAALQYLFCSALLVLTMIDLDHMILPDLLTLPGTAFGLFVSVLPAGHGIAHSLLGVLAGGGSLYLAALAYRVCAGQEGMGGGDIKLLAMMGAFLGWQAVPFIILVGSLGGSLVGVGLLLRGEGLSRAVPFGPFLSAAALLYVFCGSGIVDWYLHCGLGLA